MKHAVLSVSSLALFNASHVGELYVNARSHYGLAMKDLGQVLQQGRQDVISGDEVLGAVLFLLYFAVSLPPSNPMKKQVLKENRTWLGKWTRTGTN